MKKHCFQKKITNKNQSMVCAYVCQIMSFDALLIC
jgi:hypothetical protein